MKKTLLVSLLSLAAAGVYAQGTVVFNNRVVGTLVTHIYSPDTTSPTTEFSGNTSSDTPAGSTTYTGQLLGGLATGATSPSDYSNGNLWSVQLYAAPGSSASVSSLLPVTQYVTTMRTTGATSAGFIAPVSPSPDNGIPNTSGAAATVALAVWYNGGGTITSLAAAQTAQVPWGESGALSLTALGEPSSVTGGASTPAENLIGLQSFSIVTPTPEPSTIALGVMGISAFLIRRRK
jgi:hypothetical protein